MHVRSDVSLPWHTSFLNRSTSAPESISYHVVYDNPTQTKAALYPGQTMVLTGTVSLMVPRNVCSIISSICVNMAPSSGSTISLYPERENRFCFDISTDLKCEGKYFFSYYAEFSYKYFQIVHLAIRNSATLLKGPRNPQIPYSIENYVLGRMHLRKKITFLLDCDTDVGN